MFSELEPRLLITYQTFPASLSVAGAPLQGTNLEPDPYPAGPRAGHGPSCPSMAPNSHKQPSKVSNETDGVSPTPIPSHQFLRNLTGSWKTMFLLKGALSGSKFMGGRATDLPNEYGLQLLQSPRKKDETASTSDRFRP